MNMYTQQCHIVSHCSKTQMKFQSGRDIVLYTDA
jgi:hypothetical protein